MYDMGHHLNKGRDQAHIEVKAMFRALLSGSALRDRARDFPRIHLMSHYRIHI